MALTGRRLVTGALLGVTFAFFVPIFADAAANFSGATAYSPYIQTVLNQLPVLVAVMAVVFIGGAIANAT